MNSTELELIGAAMALHRSFELEETYSEWQGKFIRFKRACEAYENQAVCEIASSLEERPNQ